MYTYNLKNNIYIAFLTYCTHKYWNIFIQRGWDVGIICFAYKWEGEKNHKTELSSRILKKGRKNTHPNIDSDTTLQSMHKFSNFNPSASNSWYANENEETEMT